MKATAVLGVLSVVLGGCASNPVPDDYTGPTAVIRDTAIQQGTSRAVFFYVSEVDGKLVPNALSASRSASYGRGNQISARAGSRRVPAQRVVLKLEARTAHGAPIAEIFNSQNMYSASAVVTLNARPGAIYVVKGTLTHGDRRVWLEDATSGERVGEQANIEPPK